MDNEKELNYKELYLETYEALSKVYVMYNSIHMFMPTDRFFQMMQLIQLHDKHFHDTKIKPWF